MYLCMQVQSLSLSDSLWPQGLQSTRFFCPWDFRGKNIGVGCHFLLQGIFPTQGSNSHLLYWRQSLYHWATRESQCILAAAATAAESLQSCPTLCDPIDGSLLGSSVPGILPARTLEWAAISFSNAWKWKVKVKSLSRVWLFAWHHGL